MGTYRYVFLSLRSDDIIAEVDLFGVYALRQLGSTGQFTGSFVFDQTGKSNLDLVAATTPGLTWVVMEREGVPLWWGIVWSRTYQSQAKECQLSGLGFEVYPQKCKVLTDINKTNEPSTQIFGELWSELQTSTDGRNLNISIPILNAGPTKSLSVLATDQQFYSDVMDSLSTADDGFDWTIDLQKNADGSYNKSLRVGYPTMGAQRDNPNMVIFEHPGNILNYYETESMADSGTAVTIIGAGEGSEMATATVVQTGMIAAGWPRWDVDVSLKDVSDPTQVSRLANQEALNRKPPAPTIKATIKSGQDPVVGSYNVGDACEIVITDGRNPSPDGNTAGLTYPSIIAGYEIYPSDSGQTETVNVILPGDVLNG